MSDILHPRDHLRLHWRQAKADFWRQWQPCFEQGKDATRLMITLGTIRSLYWQALGLNALSIAKTIRAWWRKTAPVHQLGKVVL